MGDCERRNCREAGVLPLPPAGLRRRAPCPPLCKLVRGAAAHSTFPWLLWSR